MNCQEIQPIIQEYLDGELGSEQADEVKKHLDACGNCRAEAEELGNIIKAVAGLPRVSAPEGFAEKVIASRGETGDSATKDNIVPIRPSYLLTRIVGIAATLVVAVIIIFIVSRTSWRQERVARDERPPEAREVGQKAAGELAEKETPHLALKKFSKKAPGKAEYKKGAGGFAPGAIEAPHLEKNRQTEQAATQYDLKEAHRQTAEDMKKMHFVELDKKAAGKTGARRQESPSIAAVRPIGGAYEQTKEGLSDPTADAEPAAPPGPPSAGPAEYAGRGAPRKPERELSDGEYEEEAKAKTESETLKRGEEEKADSFKEVDRLADLDEDSEKPEAIVAKDLKKTEEKLVFRGADAERVRVLLASLRREIPNLVMVTEDEKRKAPRRAREAAPEEEKSAEKDEAGGQGRPGKAVSRNGDVADRYGGARPKTYILEVDEKSFEKVLARLKKITEERETASGEAPAPEPEESSGLKRAKKPAPRKAKKPAEIKPEDKEVELVVILRSTRTVAARPPADASTKKAHKANSK